MPRRPERILLFRSGRHLQVAIDALRSDAPGCAITVVATPPAVPLLKQAGIDEAHRLIYTETPFFRPFRFLFSRAGLRALAGRFDRVCVLWNDPDGSGHANVDQTALLVSPGGFTAITADGRLLPHRTAPLVAREGRRAIRSIAVGAALTLGLFLPARAVRLLQRS
ncbi:MAG: hypothetical protein AB7O32_05690 [Vicinamibacterales bacterium]